MSAEAFTIALAAPNDAEELVRVHHASVHQVCCTAYNDECLSVWSPDPTEARFAKYKKLISDPEQFFLVARDAKGKTVGFGSVNRATGKLATLYVHPGATGKGLGGILLQKLEAELTRHGHRKVQLMATLNAERFYQRNGYRTLRRALHNRSGVAIPALDMEKSLEEGLVHAQA